MKVRVLTGVAIGAILVFSLLCLPPLVVSFGFLCAASLAVFEIFTALGHKYSSTAAKFCWMELIMLMAATATVTFANNNYIIGYVVILCALVDVCGFFAGKLLGKRAHKVSSLKKVSPNKTWEGYIASIICSAIFGYLIHGLFGDLLPENLKYLSFIAWLPAIAGDLFESKLKRTLKISDSGEVVMKKSSKVFRLLEKPIASHGGYMDRIDSFTFAIVAYQLLTLMPW